MPLALLINGRPLCVRLSFSLSPLLYVHAHTDDLDKRLPSVNSARYNEVGSELNDLILFGFVVVYCKKKKKKKYSYKRRRRKRWLLVLKGGVEVVELGTVVEDIAVMVADLAELHFCEDVLAVGLADIPEIHGLLQGRQGAGVLVEVTGELPIGGLLVEGNSDWKGEREMGVR
jgi:hypothetical protein